MNLLPGKRMFWFVKLVSRLKSTGTTRKTRYSARASTAMALSPAQSSSKLPSLVVLMPGTSPGRHRESAVPASSLPNAGRRHEDAVAFDQSWSSCCICPSTLELLKSAWAAASKSLVTFPGSASSLVAQLIELTFVLLAVTYE